MWDPDPGSDLLIIAMVLQFLYVVDRQKYVVLSLLILPELINFDSTLQSSLGYEECIHKLAKLQLKPGQETILVKLIIECCSQERSYKKFYGYLNFTSPHIFS